MTTAEAFQNFSDACEKLATDIRRSFCRHRPKLVGTEVTGAVMSWTGGITREYKFNYCCRRCGQLSSLGGFIIPGDRRMHPDRYTANGWPIDEDGNKLKIN
jgi:hypothetical protein